MQHVIHATFNCLLGEFWVNNLILELGMYKLNNPKKPAELAKQLYILVDRNFKFLRFVEIVRTTIVLSGTDLDDL